MWKDMVGHHVSLFVVGSSTSGQPLGVLQFKGHQLEPGRNNTVITGRLGSFLSF